MRRATAPRCRRLAARPTRTASQDGATLVLALVLLLVGALILVPLVSLAGTNMTTSSNLGAQRALEFAADTAVDGAMQALRYQQPDSTTSPTCPTFPPGGGTVTVNGRSLVVRCFMGIPQVPQPYYGRIVEFDACTPSSTSFPACQAAAVVRAEVVYNDVKADPSCTSGSLPGCYGESWGTGMTLESWVVRLAAA